MVNFFGRIPNAAENGIDDFQVIIQASMQWEGKDPREIDAICNRLFLEYHQIPLWQKFVILDRKVTYNLIAGAKESAKNIIQDLVHLAEHHNDPFLKSVVHLNRAYFELMESYSDPSHLPEVLIQLDLAKESMGLTLPERNILSGKYYFILGCFKGLEGKVNEALYHFERAEWIFNELNLPYQSLSAVLCSIQVMFKDKRYHESESLLKLHKEGFKEFDIFQFKTLQILLEIFLLKYQRANSQLLKMQIKNDALYLTDLMKNMTKNNLNFPKSEVDWADRTHEKIKLLGL